MSKKVAASPLLIRHRYLNPFPPPPFPPKLLHISTDPARYAGYRFLSHLENEREIPVLANADAALPIELGLEADGSYGIGAYWEGDRSVICPDPSGSRSAWDPEDAPLLIDPAPGPGTAASIGNGISPHHSSHRPPSTPGVTPSRPAGSPLPVLADRRKPEVSWLRRTEYFNDAQHKSRESLNQSKTRPQAPPLPKTKTERLAEIHSGFEAVEKDFKSLKHPTRPQLEPVDCFELLPDEVTWPNSYHLFRFQENPTDQPDAPTHSGGLVDPRLDHAILRPVKVRGESRLAYYLPDSLDSTLKYQRLKLSDPTVDQIEREGSSTAQAENAKVEESETAHDLHLVREYEISQSRCLNQHLLIFDDGKQTKRKKGAYYHPVGGFSILRKRRPKLHENYLEDDNGQPPWDGISVTIDKDPESIESVKAPREELLAAVIEPPS